MTFRRMPHSGVSSLSPGRIALGYAVIAFLWIAFSDAAVTYLKLNPFVNTIKGSVFVFVTASLLYFTIRRLVHAIRRTSQERDETADLYRSLAQASNEGVCLLDESGRISFLNARLASMLGRAAKELQGQQLQDFLEEPQVLALPGARQSETRECQLRKDSDPKPWVLISRHPVLNDAGEVVKLVVTVIDISERKQTDQALRRSDANLAELPSARENLTESRLASPTRYAVAILSVGVALGAGLLLQYFHFHVPAALLLFAVAIGSWYGGSGPAGLAAVLAAISYYYYFVEPVHTIYIYRSEIPSFITFVAFSALLAWFGVFRRRFEAGLHKQAALLNLTHDTIFVVGMDGVIKYWNRGAEEQYGWTAENALGKVVHDLLKTVFPKPLEEIKTELIRTGRWEAELVHTKKDGTQVAVASRWSLQRDRHGAPFAILETNNNISERQRAEEALSRLNRELRAISNCNQTLLRATDEQSLLKEICRIVCEEAGYHVAWVGYAEPDEAKTVRPVAWAGIEEEELAKLGITWADSERGRGPSGTAIRTGKTCCIEDYASDPQVTPWRENALRDAFRSAIALPLKDENANAFGILNIYSTQPNAFTSEEIRLLEELAGDLAFGIVTLRSRTARDQAEQKVSLLNSAMDRVRDAVFLIDEQGRCQYANESASRILGYDRAEVLGLCIADIDPDFPAERWPDHWRELKEQQALTFESRHRTREGRVFPVEVSANYFEYEGRSYNLALVRDITERKRAEEERRESAERFRAIADYTYDWENWIGADGKLLWVNPAVERITGYSVSECMAMPDFPLPIVVEADREGLAEQIREAVQGSSRNDYEFRVRHKDGRLVWVAASWQPIYDSQGVRLGHRSSMRDITERKWAEEALCRSQEEFKDLFDNAPVGFHEVDAEGRLVRINNTELKLLGYSAEELLGQFVWKISAEEETSRRAVLAKLGGEPPPQQFERILRRKDGSTFPVLVKDRILKRGDGAIIGIRAAIQDATERMRAEQTLRASEARFRTFVDHATDAFFLFDEQRKIVDVNHQACESLGYTREELIGQGPQLVEPNTDEALLKQIQERIDAGLVFAFETHHRRKDGSLFPVEVRIRPFSQDGHRLSLALARDITDRKRAEEELRRSEAYVAEGQRLTHTGSWAWSAGGAGRDYWSEEMFRIFGFKSSEAPPALEDFLQRIHPDDYDRVTQEWEKTVREKADLIVDFRIVLPDGITRDIHIIGHPVLKTGDLVEYVGTAIDVTERKRTEEELRKHREHLEELVKQRTEELAVLNQLVYGSLESGDVAAWWIDFKERDTYYALDNAARMLGLEPDPTGKKSYKLSDWSKLLTNTAAAFPELAPVVEQAKDAFAGAVSGKYQNYRAIYPVAMSDGALKWMDARAEIARRDEHGQALFMTGTLIDVTRLKRAEADLGEAKARAEAANRAKSSFLANMSHELRTPLNAVLGFSRLLKNDPAATPQQQETLDVIVRSGEHLLNLINNVLDMAKIESGQVGLKESEVDLHRLLHEMQSLMGAGAVEKGLRFALELDPDLPRVVAVDAGKLRQVLLNLLGNAIKYTESGGVKLRARLASVHGTEEAKVRFEVEDTGRGISPEDCQRIFTAFVQLGEQTPAQGGTGLGLSICKQYVELMGGQIAVTSQPGKGAKFHFVIPVRILPDLPERDQLKHRRILGLAQGQPRCRLLIAEDQPENRLLLRKVLSPLGFELREAANGQEAVALFDQWQPHLIWMDIRMPVMDGLEAVRRIRATPAGKATKIVALTAHALEEEREPIMAAGCDDLVRKPFHEQELFEALARHLRLKFIYETAPREEAPLATPPPTLRPEQLEALPAQLRQDLRQAVVELDTARTQTLIEQVAQHDAVLGKALADLAKQLDYKRLLKLLEKES